MQPPEKPNIPLFSISTAAQLVGVSVHTIRLYEARGLFVAYKTPTNQRRYSWTDIERLRCVRRAIRDENMSIPAMKRMYALIPCWEIIGCSENDRARCPAFSASTEPCWHYSHSATMCADRDCRECRVYLIADQCEKIKASIIEATQES
jgi:MerR family transcriptional regulator/heat shock protein HspR